MIAPCNLNIHNQIDSMMKQNRQQKRQAKGRGKHKQSVLPSHYLKRLGTAMNCDYITANIAGSSKQNKEPRGMLGVRVLDIDL